MRLGLKPIFRTAVRLGDEIRMCQVYAEWDIQFNIPTGRQLAKWGNWAYYEIDQYGTAIQLISGT